MSQRRACADRWLAPLTVLLLQAPMVAAVAATAVATHGALAVKANAS
ncbi:hypothetical protein [Povalibacter sp.]